MAPRIQTSRHAVAASGLYPGQRAQPLLSRDAPYATQPMVDSFDDASPQHYTLASNGTSRRHRHEQGFSWDSDRSPFPDQGPYAAMSLSTQGPYTMNPVDAVYSQAMMAGFEATAPPDAMTNSFAPVDVNPAGRHQVFDDQDIVQDPILGLDMDEYSTCSSQSTAPYTAHTVYHYGLPSPPMENTRHLDTVDGSNCMLGNVGIPTDRYNRHGGLVLGDIDMCRDISAYDEMQSDAYSRHSDMKCTSVRPRPLRSALERHEYSSDDSYQGDTRPREHVHDRKKPLARSDQMYEVGPGSDGFYRCPYSGTRECSHKPTKQKCIYDKNLDSHLKPYKCPEKNCEDSSFSSNACLFRHQREAHGLFGHSAHLCHWSNCERAQPGNGFPRKWNLGDHMKRVHGYDMNQAGAGEDSSRRRRAPSSAVPMRRSTSSKDKALAASSASHTRLDRHAVTATRQSTRPAPMSCSAYRGLTGCNASFPYQDLANPYDNVTYSQHSRHSQPLVSF